MTMLRVVTLRRFHRDWMGKVGKVTTDDLGYRCVSIELPRDGNHPDISCLPAGEYEVVWSYSPKFRKYTYEVREPYPDRAGFRVHSGNYAGDVAHGWLTHSLGCPLFGKYVGYLTPLGKKPQRAVLVSRPAMLAFERHMDHKPFKLKIIEDLQTDLIG